MWPVNGPDILVRTLTVPVAMGKSKGMWQYHSRSDRHSKVACWGILFDLLGACSLLADHVRQGKIVFGINHEMRDFKLNRRKNLDLVLCSPASGPRKGMRFDDLVDRYKIVLSDHEKSVLETLPALECATVGTVCCALEAKACMTEHMKARPRLYDELNSSHQTIHGASDMVIAVGFVMVNVAREFISPGRTGGEVSVHRQPEVTQKVIAKVEELPRRASTGQEGFDAMSISVVDCRNDGVSPVTLVTGPPSPQPGEIFQYDSMIRRVAHVYESRFPRI
jgi:hypothetical protein